MNERFFVRCGLAAGLLLSVASALNLCTTDACSETHKYTLLGVPMGLLGIAFFILLGIIYELGRVRKQFSALFILALIGASGAEAGFILIQKYRIQKWCPICLAVAAAVYFVAVVISYGGLKELVSKIKQRRIMIMSLIRQAVIAVTVLIIGFSVIYRGVQKSEAEENVPSIFLGKQDGAVEVFIMTDWFCPACQKVEQEIEDLIPEVGKKAKIIFVDIPIHPETLNYAPHNLSFLMYEKGRYLELRKALLNLTKKTREPSVEDVREAVKPLNVTYKPLSFLEATKGIKYYSTVASEFKVSATPTVVIRGKKTGKVVKLVGMKEITGDRILKAIDEGVR